MNDNSNDKNENELKRYYMYLKLTVFTAFFIGTITLIFNYLMQYSTYSGSELDNEHYQIILSNYEKYPSNEKMIFLLNNFYNGDNTGINKNMYKTYFRTLMTKKVEDNDYLNYIITLKLMKVNDYDNDEENAIRQSHYTKFDKILNDYKQNEILKSDYLAIQGLLLEDNQELKNKINAMLDDLKITIAEYNSLYTYIGASIPISIKYTQDREKNLNETIAKILAQVKK